MSYSGIFGQVPSNGGYVTSSGRRGVFGQIPSAQKVYLDPPTHNDDGIRTIDPSSKPTFLWSVNMTTSSDPSMGATTTIVPGYNDTLSMVVVSGVGDSWLGAFVDAGYVALYMAQELEDIDNTLGFYLTKDPRFIAENASVGANLMVLIDGPEPLIAAAKAIVGQGQPQVPVPPVLPSQVPPIPGLPSPGAPAPSPSPSATCPAGQVGIPPYCIALPGIPQVPPAPTPTPPPPQPQPTPAPSTPPTKQPDPGAAQVAATGVPMWLLPVLIGAGALSIFVLVARGKKREAGA